MLSFVCEFLVFIIFNAVVLFSVDNSVGEHSLAPKLERFNRYGYALELILNVNEILNFRVVDFSVNRYLDKSLATSVHCVE